MAHCVADYWRGCLLRQVRIVHLQLADGDTEGEQATAQFDPVQDAAEAGYCLAELRGRFNQDSSAAMEAFAERLLARINDDRHLARRRRVRDEAEQHRRAFGSVERRGNTQRLDRRSRAELRQVLEYCLKQPDWQARPEILYVAMNGDDVRCIASALVILLLSSQREIDSMRVTSKGQVTIPHDIREALEILPSSEVEFVRDNGRVWLRKRERGEKHARELVGRMRGRATTKLSTDEIMRLTRGVDA